MAHLAEDLRFRGLIHQMTDPALEERLDADRLTALQRLRPHRRQPARGPPPADLQPAPAPAGRPPAHRRGRRGTGFIGDPGGKSEERTLLSDEELAANLAGIRAQLERFLDFDGDGAGARAVLVDNADWLAPAAAVRVPPRRGQALHRQPDGGQGLGQVPAGARRPGHLVHRVQLHAAAGLRLPPPLRHLRVPAAARGQRPVGEHHHGHRAHPQGAPGRRCGASPPRWWSRPTGPSSARPSPARSGSTRTGPARTSCTSSSSAARTPWSGPTSATSPSCPTRPSSSSTRPPPPIPSGARPSGSWPARCARWSTAPTRPTGPSRPPPPCSARSVDQLDERSLLDVFADAPSTTGAPGPARRPGVTLVDLLVETGLAPVQGPGPDHRRTGWRLRQQPPGGRRRPARSDPTTWWPAATWCSVGARRTTTW